MDAAELSQLIEQRHMILKHLLGLGGQQIRAIQAGHMSELMQILAEKQGPLQELGEISARMRPAAGQDPQSRRWPSEAAREACRRAQDECEQMHIELLAIEAECETALTDSRHRLQEKLSKIDSAQQAANQYASVEAQPTSGARLDLSSD